MKVLRKRIGQDHSEKYLMELEDGNTIETLYMFDEKRQLTFHNTVCVSSQVGCGMGCRFCATGKQGFTRNLSMKEIVGQVDVCNSTRENARTVPIDAVVFAGMGEPLLNYEQVKAAILVMRSRLGISHFELATVGIVPKIYELIKDFQGTDISIRLNISLHASSDDQRRLIIPMTERYSMYKIIQAATDYAIAFGVKVRIRYMLFRDFNGKAEDIRRLTDLLEGKPMKLIISQYNENNIQGLIPSGRLEVLEFYNTISTAIDSEIFHNFGSDIQGGCGQLKQTMVV
ncbi:MULTISPECIES: radical SAM protein [Pelosinus]|jgi:23S rRNA (adenine2503-C2)-methyltransferase|uniref:Radical SAM domain protein n=1 Tax=Pelosinus fermentans B4 TaxID=1149862 RepID=I8RDU0_9FIRM|nr:MULTISPECIES: radical SAM protein [Pelosinus]EIW15640.1 Radical SAM domain protein [Pelosinus fermentans B4]EIW26670.1 Radical SAM domain protein [Pelosinus fermentans A11]OAM92385.1 Radical SAM domain protein [Pelosinus fermentans DSM 17108]SDQ43027.1 23S rRNA (adenine2503-C2)-methyltransferase [Pelosinus fermentans]